MTLVFCLHVNSLSPPCPARSEIVPLASSQSPRIPISVLVGSLILFLLLAAAPIWLVGTFCALRSRGAGANPIQETVSWWERFLCEITAADYAIALFTFVLAVVTSLLWLSTDKLWKAARGEFIATHRPRIMIRKMEIGSGNTVEISFSVVNVGESAAALFEYAVEVRLLDKDNIPAVPKYSARSPLSRTLAAGEEEVISASYEGDTFSAWFEQSVYEKERSGNHIFVNGYIRYRDDNGVVRESAFLREYNGSRFEVVHNPDFEYSD
jgi:hypothetical protein